MTNKNRGEIIVELDGTDYTIRPTFQAICSIEAATDNSIISILSSLKESNLTLDQITSIVFYGISACKEHSFTKKEVGEKIYRSGIIKILPKAIKFLEYAIGVDGESND